ncbi:MAG: Zn-dependent hydrolase [Synechococcus sp. MED850]|nr:Zn-dependent hydrolase [Synechococcus sp. MED850]OUW97490.1 MAG: Zn-dependent hydrolase [Cyanobacteria bacterium TMED229]
MQQLLSFRQQSAPALTSEGKTAVRPNKTRLVRSLNEMASIGLQTDGSVCRRGFSETDVQGRDQLAAWMAAIGLNVRIDAAGNLIGRLEGSDPELPALLTGSHLDTVPTGGRFDGALGVLAGLEAIRSLQDNAIQLRHPLELIAFADEESTMVGCKGLVGTASDCPSDYATSNGESIEANLARIGGHWPSLSSAQRAETAVAAFLELHVEQGAVLEQRGHSIGVVEGVVGQRRFSIRVRGQANHAGTTPMDLRQDALVAASRIVLAIESMAVEHPGDPVATVGRLEVWPNAANVVPGSVTLTVDLRDLNPSVLDQLVTQLMQSLETIGEQTGCAICLDPQFEVAPTPAHADVMAMIEASAQSLGLSHSRLPSRASHDAQEVGRRWPMGMIFVPSKGGFSHSAAEFTSEEQCWEGTAVLLEVLQRLDRSLA